MSRVAEAPVPRRKRVRRRVAAGVAAAAVVLAAPLTPAIAEWLGIGGVEIREVPARPSIPDTSTVSPLGREVTADEAEQLLGAPIAHPALLGRPRGYWIAGRSGSLVVTLDYGTYLVSQFELPLARDVVAAKFAEPDVVIDDVDVAGSRGLWIEGAHGIALLGPDGNIVLETMRLSANALVWERDGVTYRIETEGRLTEALEVARSMP